MNKNRQLSKTTHVPVMFRCPFHFLNRSNGNFPVLVHSWHQSCTTAMMCVVLANKCSSPVGQASTVIILGVSAPAVNSYTYCT